MILCNPTKALDKGVLNMTKLFIGMPVYNGARFISQALDSLIDQKFHDWSLLIADNASDDDTENICKKYCSKDQRMQYFRHERNIGAAANFKYLLDRADAAYFMWAAADDVWHPEFLTSCIGVLEKNHSIGVAFCNTVNIDVYGNVIRSYPDFSVFANSSRFVNICRFLISPEIHGKANIIYSCYRLSLLKDVWEASPLTDRWGSDMCFVLAALARYNLTIDNRILFQKRIITTDGAKEKVINPYKHIFTLEDSVQYITGNLKAVEGTGFYLLTLVIMMIRLPNAIINWLDGKFRKIKLKLTKLFD